jgi:hypothetical protein
MTIDEIIIAIQKEYTGLVVKENWGETGLFYNPESRLKKGIYLLTFKEKDGKHDVSPNLKRKDIYRLNLGISKDTFLTLFEFIPKRPNVGGVVEMNFDFSQIDTIMPHPIYAWMAWICVLNPTEKTFQTLLLPLIQEGYLLAIEKYRKKNFKFF